MCTHEKVIMITIFKKLQESLKGGNKGKGIKRVIEGEIKSKYIISMYRNIIRKPLTLYN
jgi:hypothetical protein